MQLMKYKSSPRRAVSSQLWDYTPPIFIRQVNHFLVTKIFEDLVDFVSLVHLLQRIVNHSSNPCPKIWNKHAQSSTFFIFKVIVFPYNGALSFPV